MEFYFLTVLLFLGRECSGDAGVDGQSAPSRELRVDQLGYFVTTDEGKAILETEFQSIKGGKRRSWTIAERPENLPKNRYDDLLAFDETRVVLANRSYDTDSDYINANYIDGYHGEKEYVATQGPLPNTTWDFWTMIWQLNATKIVMLANLIEHGQSKVAKYWPDTNGTYGDITVTMLSEHPLLQINHVLRKFSLRKAGYVHERIVRHFHYTGWPDLGVPNDRMSVVALMEEVRKYRPECKSPIVLHCSAGIGRTGTVILTDSMIERAKNEGTVDFPRRLDSMRLQRPDVVEKKEQYIFAHQAVYDLFNGTSAEEYLKNVDNLYKSSDPEMFDEIDPDSVDMQKTIDEMKSQNHKMNVLIRAIETAYNSRTP